MRPFRLVSIAVAAAIIAATAAPAGAATEGEGATVGSLSVLGIDLGDVLQLDLLTDGGLANSDPDNGGPVAGASLSALSIASELLGTSHEVPLLQVTSTGEEQTASQAVQPIENPAVAGSILPADLSALVGADGPLSNLGAGVADLNVLDGVLGISSTALSLASSAQTTQADGARALSVDGLSVLDLDALLAGLGIPLTDLPIDTVLELVDGLGLLDQLGAVLEPLGLPIDLTDLSVESLTGLLGDLESIPDLVSSLSEGSVCDVTDPVLGLAGGLLGEDATTLCTDVTNTVTELTGIDVDALLGTILGTALGQLDNLSLLSLDALDVGMVTRATDSLETSTADVSAVLEGLTVGTLELPGLDPLTLVGQVESTLGSILSAIDPALSDLIDVGLLEEQTSVTEDGDAIDAVASFTGLRVDVLPDLEVLTGIISGLAGTESIGDVLTGLGVDFALSPLTVLAETLGGAAGGVGVIGLAEGLSVQVASLQQASTFAEVLSGTATPEPVPAAPETPELPNTGSNDTVMLLVAAIAAAGALGVRRLVRR